MSSVVSFIRQSHSEVKLKKVINEFATASPLSKLATFADIATILGVSVATFVAGPFLSEITGLGFSAPEFIVAILIYSILLVTLIGILTIPWEIIKGYREKSDSGDAALWVFVFLLLVALYFNFLTPVKSFFGDLTNNRYLLPVSAEKAIEKINEVKLVKLGDRYTLKGKLTFTKEVEPIEYVAAIYKIDRTSGLYVLHSSKNDEKFEINSSGIFNVPSIESEDALKNGVLVIFRELDSNRTSSYDFPNQLSVVPNTELDVMGAYSYNLEL